MAKPVLTAPETQSERTSKSANELRAAREQLEEAEALRQRRKFDRAETICTSLVRRYPNYFGALHPLGLICADKNDNRRALGYLVQATMLNPESWMTHTALAGVYLALDAPEMAARTLEQARALNPREPSTLVTLGQVYSEEREYELARKAFRDALNAEPGMEEAAVGLAHAAIALDDNDEAATALGDVVQRGRASILTMAALADLPLPLVPCEILAELEKVASRSNRTDSDFQTRMSFVRANALHNAGRHSEAWNLVMAANQLIAANTKNDLLRFAAEQHAHYKWLEENSISAKPSASGEEKIPISLFILDLPGPGRRRWSAS